MYYKYLHVLYCLLIADGCPVDMTFQQCGPVCPQSCDSTDATCHSGCAEGCFCPDGQIVNQDGECDDFMPCPGETNSTVNLPMVCIFRSF